MLSFQIKLYNIPEITYVETIKWQTNNWKSNARFKNNTMKALYFIIMKDY